ncbi:MAG: hypothetical protein WDN45_13600 [Caulobacteraceae bacterium]
MTQTTQASRRPAKTPTTPSARGTGMFTLAAIFIYLLVCVAVGAQEPTATCGAQACVERATR